MIQWSRPFEKIMARLGEPMWEYPSDKRIKELEESEMYALRAIDHYQDMINDAEVRVAVMCKIADECIEILKHIVKNNCSSESLEYGCQKMRKMEESIK